jgi:hypothetical protein
MARYRLNKGIEVSSNVARREEVDSSSVGREAGAGSVVGKLGLSWKNEIGERLTNDPGFPIPMPFSTHSSCLARPSSVK